MAISETARRAVQAVNTAEVYLDLLTIDHPDLGGNPIRLVNNAVDVRSRSNTYAASAFSLTWPSQAPDGAPTAAIEVENISRAIEETLATLISEPVFTAEAVLASAPDTVVFGPWALPLAGAETSRNSIRLTLGGADPLLLKQFPRARFSSEQFPGLSAS